MECRMEEWMRGVWLVPAVSSLFHLDTKLREASKGGGSSDW